MSATTISEPPARIRGGLGALHAALVDIKLAHSVFAMPFALLAAVMALPPAAGWRRPALALAMVALAMFFARTWAMLVNRLADRRFDAANPRTAGRALPAGRLGVPAAFALALASALLFQLVAIGFWLLLDNPLPTLLAVPVLLWIALYSFTKQWTVLCHLFLGGALAASPLAAVIAVGPEHLAGGLTPTGAAVLALAGFVACWVAGFDVAYALQDIDVDRRLGLRSVPAALGVRGALWTSRVAHALAMALLLLAWWLEPRFGAIAASGIAVVAALLAVEHVVLARRGVAGLPMAFFTLNGIVAIVLGAAGIVNLLVG